MTLRKSTAHSNSPPNCRPISSGIPSLRLILCICTIIGSLIAIKTASAATFCSTPGKDGAGTPSGVVNTYFPATASASAGATSITIGSSSGASKAIAIGDLLLVIQMQDADISTSNDSNYGSATGTGAGYTNQNAAGLYEFVKATNAVATGGGTVTLATGLTNSYRSRAVSTTNGQSTFQVVRVPQYSTALVSGTLSAAAWDGAKGGIVAIDVAGALTISGTVEANGKGFRGGWGESGTTTGPDTDYRTLVTVLGNGMKGEGIAGTPNRMNQPASFNGAPVQTTTGTSLGYPSAIKPNAINASKGRGAPGNGGGGGTDGATNNSENSGGGGGGNFGPGGGGGNSWSSNLPVGGEGGGAVSISFNRIVLGGGGGAGTTNDGTADNTTYSNPPGNACSTTGGRCSSGAPGGGIIILRAQSIAGSGSISAHGGTGYNTENDSAGGGGAGGSVVVETHLGGNSTVDVSGGDGGNAWRSHTTTADRHGPGGGGSGGFVAYSPAGLSISANTAGGVNGKSCNNDAYGSGSSSGGTYAYQVPNIPGSGSGFDCRPRLSKAYSATPIGVGASSTLTFTIINSTGNPAQSGLAFTDTFPAGLSVTFVGAISGTGCSGTPAFTASTVSLTAGAITAGNSTCTFTATVRGGTAGSYLNDSTRFSSIGGLLDTSDTTATLTVYDLPLISVLKSANMSTAKPGQVIVYTVQVVNTGAGVGTDVILTDDLSPYGAFSMNSYGGLPFSFTDSSPASGLSLGAPQYSNTNGTIWGVYSPVSGGGGAPAGYDSNVTNWRIPMTGSIKAGGRFILNYQIVVK